MAPTIQAVSIISTLHIIAVRHTSMLLAMISAVIIPRLFDPVCLLKKRQVAMPMAIAAMALGRRDVYSVTPPVNSDSTAMHQARKGGLYGISHPKLSGSIQLPLCSIDTATMASLGSPLVLNGDIPSHGRNKMASSTDAVNTGCLRSMWMRFTAVCVLDIDNSSKYSKCARNIRHYSVHLHSWNQYF